MTGRRWVRLKMVGRNKWAGLRNEGRGLKMGREPQNGASSKIRSP